MNNPPLSARFSQLRLKHLGLLDLIAQTGSLRQASIALSVTQPAVTAMLQDMEALFGVSLVERNSNGARLTPPGMAIQERLRIVLNTLSVVEAEISQPVVHRHLRVGVLALAMINIVPAAIAKLRKMRPDITFSFQEGTVSEVAHGILDGKLDCAIGRFDSEIAVSMQSALDARLIRDVPLQAACGRSNPLGKAARLTLKDLKDHSWILGPLGSVARDSFEQAFLLAGLVPPPPTVESISFYANFHLAAKTDMLTISTATAVEQYTKLGLVKPLPLKWPIKLPPLMFFCRKEAASLEAMRLFRDMVIREAEAG